jgi:AcrR family transcriptional regulator/acyl-CoA thioesterase FadM
MSRAASPRQPRPDTRRELIDATRRVIQRTGIANATVGEITREAGASLGLLNYHFASKGDVVAEAFAEVARMELAELQDISRRHDDPADRLAAYLDLEEWADRESWSLWVDAWGEAVHLDALRDTLDRFAAGWRAVLAEVIADGARQGRWTCADPAETAARLTAVLDGIGLHSTVHAHDVDPARATAWARRLAELELGVTLPDAPPPLPERPPGRPHETHITIRARDLDAYGRVDPAVLLTYLQEARDAWLRARLTGVDARVAHVAVDFRRPLGRRDGTAVVRCALDAAGRSGVRTRETIATAGGTIVVGASTTLEVMDAETGRPRALSAGEREALER